MSERILTAAESLADYAEHGRSIGGHHRELTILWPYLIRYRLEGDDVFILRVRHGARSEDES